MKFTDVKPSRGWKLVRNENFTPLPNIADGAPDQIDATIVKNQRRQVADVLSGKVEHDLRQPDPRSDAARAQRGPGPFKAEITNSTYYFFSTTRWRRSTTRRCARPSALRSTSAPLSGSLRHDGAHLQLPAAGMKGYKKIDPCPYGDPTKGPNLEKAKAMIQEPAWPARPSPCGATMRISAAAFTEYLADTLNQIGLKAKPRIVEASTYFQVIGNQKTKPQIGFANWFQDFPHPRTSCS